MKRKREILFWIITALLFLGAVGYTVYAIGFVARRVNEALSRETGPGAPIPHFDFNALEPLIKSGKLQRL